MNNNQRTQLLIYHSVILIVLMVYFLINTKLYLFHTGWVILSAASFIGVVLLLEFLFYNYLTKFCMKYAGKVLSLIFFTLLILIPIFLFMLVPKNLFVLFLMVIIMILSILVFDLILFGIKFGPTYTTKFERFFLSFLFFIGGMALFSLFSKEVADQLSKYGDAATLLSFVFAFILFYMSEFQNRVEKRRTEKDIDTNEILKENKDLKKRINELENMVNIQNEVKKISKKLGQAEESLIKHMNQKTSQIINKTKSK